MNLQRLIQNHLLKRSIVSYLLYPLGQCYALVQSQRRKLNFIKPYVATCKVISIGNIVSGGSGKTPLTIAIARLLANRGLQVAVSHRGYKGKFEHIPHLISDCTTVLYPAEIAGDEAYLIAASLPGIPVVVGRKRKDAIRLLLKHYPATQVVLMDDAFQHIRVHRDLDIVSFSAEIGIGNGFVIPAGYLREKLTALSEACMVMIYRTMPGTETYNWETSIASTVRHVFHSKAAVAGFIDASGKRFDIGHLRGKRMVLVSGIANPASFEATIRKVGLSYSRHYAFPDHYCFADSEIAAQVMQEMPEIILCTQKDIMKLARYSSLESRLLAVVLDYVLEDQEAVIKALLESLQI